MNSYIPAWVDGALCAVDKLDVHRRGLRHKAISVFVLSGDKVLLQRRAPGKYHTPGLWTNTCCTHPLWDEPDAACASRRLHEELGITGLDLHHRGEIEYRADVGNGLIEHELVQVYVAHAPADLCVTPHPDEVDQIDWVSVGSLCQMVEALPERFTPWLAIYLRDHRDMIFDQPPAWTHETRISHLRVKRIADCVAEPTG
jgi:isopentenyl-diphosphate delta-isomerase